MEENVDLYLGDCLEELRSIPDNSVDSIVTDPPYGLSNQPDMMEVLRHWMAGDDYVHKGKGFMGKTWDSFVPGPSVWKECLRVLKPGGHLLCFAGTRTQDMMGLAIRLAGFELRDSLVWAYGSGFPKSHNISVAIDKLAGAEREVVGVSNRHGGGAKVFENQGGAGFATNGKPDMTAPATEAAKQWEGFGSALKPAYEPVLLCRKPLDGTLAQNTLEHGCGGLNIDGCRVETASGEIVEQSGEKVDIDRGKCAEGYDRPNATMFRTGKPKERGGPSNPTGRFPANLIHDNSEEVVACFPETKSGALKPYKEKHVNPSSYSFRRDKTFTQEPNAGSAARFFKTCPDNDPEDLEARRLIYCAKASKRDRDEGCEGLAETKTGFSNGAQLHGEGYDKGQDIGLNRVISRKNSHPTVKPTELMRYLVRLVTPPNGTTLDPFMGSGSTGKAAMLEGFRFIGIEREPEYLRIAAARIKFAIEQNAR